MSKQEIKNPKENLEQFVAERQSWLKEAAKILGGPEAAPGEIFAPPTQVRADSPELDLTDEQEASMREIAARFGLGGERDVIGGAEVDIIEGGKPWKILAESAISNPTKVKVFAGSPYRNIGADESDFMQSQYDASDIETEYDMVKFIAGQKEGFVPLEEEVLPFGYEIDDEFQVHEEPTGQLVRLGVMQYEDGSEADVIVLRVDREDYQNDAGEKKYRNQPNSAQVMGIVSYVLTSLGDEESSVGIVTSSTYPSRAIDTVRAGLSRGREFVTSMYGRHTLAEVKGEPTAAPTDINQIPGELHVLNEKIEELAAEIANTTLADADIFDR